MWANLQIFGGIIVHLSEIKPFFCVKSNVVCVTCCQPHARCSGALLGVWRIGCYVFFEKKYGKPSHTESFPYHI